MFMSGTVGEAGKTLGAATAVSGSTIALAHGPLKVVAVIVLAAASVGGVFTVLVSIARHLIVRD
jgi:hypothetical protein